MNIYCDESGGVGRGVMTLAALAIPQDQADTVLDRFKEVTGTKGEVKGSRIDLAERAFLFELLAKTDFKASVSVAVSATKPDQGEDRGDHDRAVYSAMLDQAISALLPKAAGCAHVMIDDGRYAPNVLEMVRADIGRIIGPFGLSQLQRSHLAAGLQLADVMANSFFNRALPTDRQAQMAAVVAPFLEDGRISLSILPAETVA
jgi:hypothetical protein